MTRNRTDNPAETANALRPETRTRWLRLRASCDGDGEHAPLIHFHRHFPETGHTHQFIDFGRRPATHDPGLPFPITQNARNELDLRMPGLIRVNQITARLDRSGKPAK